jgi:hypothetical protein
MKAVITTFGFHPRHVVTQCSEVAVLLSWGWHHQHRQHDSSIFRPEDADTSSLVVCT